MRFKVKGVNDEKDTCECCGKEGLKRVVWIEDTETLEVRHFGTTCAANPAKAYGLKREIASAVREWEAAASKAKRDARNVAILKACSDVAESYPGEWVERVFSAGPRKGESFRVPADVDAYEVYKKECLKRVLGL